MASELICFDEKTNKFEVPHHALSLLRSLNGSICVLAICGRSREGKSFLLNQLAARLQGASAAGTSAQGSSYLASGRFAVGGTVKPCTRGLWLWSQPLQRKLPNDQTCNVLLLDAEGMDAYNQTADYSNHVFSLALLLSSVLIYNQMGSIDESSVENLARVCESARLICGKADTGTAAGSVAAASAIPADVSPAFVWLLRDFQLHLQEGGRQITYRDYMEKVLEERSGTYEAVRSKNQIRASIKTLFPDRDCHALVRPINDETRLAKMDTLTFSELRPEFRKGFDSLVDLLLQRCRPKTLHGGRPLTGSMLAGLAEAYCRVINEGHVPNMVSTWQAVVQGECRGALDMAVELYRKRLEKAREAQVNLQALEGIHRAALEAAMEAFRQKAMGSDKDQEASLQRLRETAASLVEPLRHMKRTETQRRALQLLEAEAVRFKTAIFAEDSDLTGAVSQLHEFLREYGMNESLGPDKYVWVAEFLAGTIAGEMKHLAQETRTRHKVAMEHIANLEASNAQLNKGIEILQRNMNDAVMADVQRRRELAEAKAEAAAARGALTAANDEAAVLRRRLQEARVELEARANALGLARLQSELAVAKAQQQAAEEEARSAKAARTAAVQQLATRTAEVAAQTGSARRAMEAAKAEAQRREELLVAQLATRDATVANLKRERDALLTSIELLRTWSATPAAAAANAAGMAAHAAADGGGSAGTTAAAAAATATAVAANTAARNAYHTLVPRPASTPPRQVMQGKRSRVAIGAGPNCGGDHDDDDDVVMVEVEEEGPTEVAAEQRPTRRRRTAAAEQDQQLQSHGNGATTPARTAARGGTGAGTASTGDPSPFSEEREVVLSRSRVWIGAPGAATTTTASPAQAAGIGAGSTPPHRRATENAVNTMAAVADIATPPASAAAAATAPGGSRPQLPHNINSMTVDTLKDWLTRHGWEEEVFAMSLGRKVTRKEWADVVRWKCSGGLPPQVLSSRSRGKPQP